MRHGRDLRVTSAADGGAAPRPAVGLGTCRRLQLMFEAYHAGSRAAAVFNTCKSVHIGKSTRAARKRWGKDLHHTASEQKRAL